PGSANAAPRARAHSAAAPAASPPTDPTPPRATDPPPPPSPPPGPSSIAWLSPRGVRSPRRALTPFNAADPAAWRGIPGITRAPGRRLHSLPMHFDAHQPIIDDLEARILTIRDSL